MIIALFRSLSCHVLFVLTTVDAIECSRIRQDSSVATTATPTRTEPQLLTDCCSPVARQVIQPVEADTWSALTLGEGATLLDGSSKGRAHDGFAVLSKQLVGFLLTGFERDCVLVKHLDGVGDLDPGWVSLGRVLQ